MPSTYFHSSLSYALEMSSLRPVIPRFPYVCHLIQWLISYANNALSVSSRPSIKALRLSDMRVWRHGLSLLASTFDTILTNTLHNEIGLSSVICWGFFTFGIKHTNVRFILIGISPVVKNFVPNSVTSLPTMFQNT